MLHNYNLYLNRYTLPQDNAIDLSEVKLFLNITNQEQDRLLTSLLSMATEYAEWCTERSLRNQQWQILCEGYIPQRIDLTFGPINRVETITFTVDKAQVELSAENDYLLEQLAHYVKFRRLVGIGKINIIYSAGYKNSNEIPAPIREGILHHIASAYNNRGDDKINSSIRQIYESYRNWKLTF